MPINDKMTDEDFIEDRQKALLASIEYFSSENKSEREKWVCNEFLTNLRFNFSDSEIVPVEDDPPDIIFREAAFEIKEILDNGRRRHDEYKNAYKKSLEFTKPGDFLTQYSPLDIKPAEIGILILSKMGDLSKHYAPTTRSKIDLLFYINLQDYFIKDGPMPNKLKFDTFGWRSISALFGFEALVFFTAQDAPQFLRSKVGTISQRKIE